MARSRYETGTQSATGVFQAETEVSKLQETRKDLERRISDEKLQLNILMNRDAFDPLGIPRKETIRRMDLPLTQLKSRMLAQRPEVRMAQAQVEAEKVVAACCEWIPDPAISVQGQLYNDTQHTASEFNTGISFSIPWVNYGKYSAGTKRPSNLAAAQAELDRVQKDSLGLLRDQLQKIETTHHHAELFQETPQAERPLRQAGLCTSPARGNFPIGSPHNACSGTRRPRR